MQSWLVPAFQSVPPVLTVQSVKPLQLQIWFVLELGRNARTHQPMKVLRDCSEPSDRGWCFCGYHADAYPQTNEDFADLT